MEKEFASDLEFENQYYGYLVRSEEANASLADIEIPCLPENYAFISAKDIKGCNYISMFGRRIPVFAEGKTEYAGQVFGLLAGTDKTTVKFLAKQIKLKPPENTAKNKFTLEEAEKDLPAFEVIINRKKEKGCTEDFFKEEDEEESGGKDEGKIKLEAEEAAPDSVTEEKENFEENGEGAAEENVSDDYEEDSKEPAAPLEEEKYAAEKNVRTIKGRKIISSVFKAAPRYHYHAEPASVRVKYKKDMLEIFVPTQWAAHVLNSAAEVCAIPAEKIRVINCKEAQSLNGRLWFPSLLAAQAAAASQVLKKNIAVDFSRREDFLYTTKSPAVLIRHKSAVSESGKLEAMEIFILADAGSFNPLIEEVIHHMIITSLGIYEVPVFKVEAAAVKSGAGLTDLLSGWGDAFVTSSLEKHISEIADVLGLDPVQFRLDNLLKADSPNMTGIIKKREFEFENLMKAVCGASAFQRKYAAYRSLNKMRKDRYDGYWRGIGIAAGLQYNGARALVKAGINYTVEMTLSTGSELFIKAEPTTDGQKRVLKQRISKKLNMDESKIFFEDADGMDINMIGPSASSCGVTIIPDLIDKCAAGIQKRMFRDPLPLTEIRTYKVSGKSGWDNESLEGQAFISETPGACVAELEFNPSTYEVKVRNLWFASEPGEFFSKQSLVRSLNRSIINVLSGISAEKMPENYTKPSDYTIISAEDIPDIHIFILDNSEADTRGVGNLASNLVPAAYMSALNQIIGEQTGTINSIPIDAETIFSIFNSEENKKESEEITDESEV